jgi:hypothetical protein
MPSHRLVIAVVLGVLLALSFKLPVRSATPKSNADVTVYVTTKGKKYHISSCRYLRKSATPLKLRDAVKAGYSPCSVCKPPVLEQ